MYAKLNGKLHKCLKKPSESMQEPNFKSVFQRKMDLKCDIVHIGQLDYREMSCNTRKFERNDELTAVWSIFQNTEKFANDSHRLSIFHLRSSDKRCQHSIIC